MCTWCSWSGLGITRGAQSSGWALNLRLDFVKLLLTILNVFLFFIRFLAALGNVCSLDLSIGLFLTIIGSTISIIWNMKTEDIYEAFWILWYWLYYYLVKIMWQTPIQNKSALILIIDVISEYARKIVLFIWCDLIIYVNSYIYSQLIT